MLTPALQDLIATTRATLEKIAADYTPAVFASSLAAEDMVLTDMILRGKLRDQIGIFTLETGRLHRETLNMLDRIKQTYDYEVTSYRPEPAAIAQYISEHGLNAFYDSVDLRQQCCRIRKIEPLKRALAGKHAWLTGQRRAQSLTRAALNVQEEDPAHDMVKFNPLVDWSEEDVWQYIRNHQVPYNQLHDQGYPSVGCQPCTRAIKLGEDIRAGRWWWEHPDSKECGLHVVDGKLIRIKSST